MNTFLEQMAELLEEDNVQLTDKLSDFESWDSLTQLSIIALADEYYQVQISAKELMSAETVGGVKQLIDAKKSN